MPSKKRGSKVKKDRLALILKSRKITITKMAEDMGYNRSALSYAINREYMDDVTLDDITDYLDVHPDFLTGAYPLRRLKSKYMDLAEDYNLDPSGYDFPPKFISKYPYEDTTRGGWYDVYRDFLVGLGEIGVMETIDDKERIFYDPKFVYENSGYLVPPIRAAIIEQIKSAHYKNADYLEWYKQNAAQLKSDDDKFAEYDNMFDVIEEGVDPDGDEDA